MGTVLSGKIEPACYPALDGTKVQANASKHKAMSYSDYQGREGA